MANDEEIEKAFQRWKETAELQLKYISTLGVYKKDAAMAALREAVAAGQLAKAQGINRTIHELDHALDQLKKFENKVAKKAAQIESKAKDAARIRRGQELDADLISHVWTGFAFFQGMCSQEVLDWLSETPIDDNVRPGSNYCLNRSPETQCKDVPDEETVVDGLLSWLKKNRYMPRRGRPAYAFVTKAFSKVASVASDESAKLEKSLAEMEKKTYDTWTPVILSLLADDEAAKAILKSSLDDN